MDKATEPKPQSRAGGQPRPKGSKTSKLSIHEERTIRVPSPPDGSRFKGYADFIVQDLVIRPHVVNFRCERWQTPQGDRITASLPDGINGHFGPQLRRFVLAQYHQGQVTMPRLLALLHSFGILISKRQLVRLLIAGQDGFLDEARDVLRAGLASAAIRRRHSWPAGQKRPAPRWHPLRSVWHHNKSRGNFSNRCAPAMAIMSLMPAPGPCANAPRGPVIARRQSTRINTSPISRWAAHTPGVSAA
jgi:hypothetical protein